MRKFSISISFLILIIFSISGCSPIINKEACFSHVYLVTTVLSFLMLIGYHFFIKKKEKWLFFLFISIFVVNVGYLSLSVSSTLEQALMANRIAYLGSAFLPFFMLMIIFNVSKFNYKKWIPGVLFVISVIVFLIAASPGYLNIYYKSVSLSTMNGVSVLVKEYGTWHNIYLFYLFGYFGVMVAIIFHAIKMNKIEIHTHGIILLIAVLVNILVWLLEQFTNIEFEFLSISYLITEGFLICLYSMMQAQEKILSDWKNQIESKESDKKVAKCRIVQKDKAEYLEHCLYLSENLHSLTTTERKIYDFYLDGKGTKEIMQELNIAENTLKFHNKNIYGKLGVSSRKQLIEFSKYLDEIQSV